MEELTFGWSMILDFATINKYTKYHIIIKVKLGKLFNY